MEDKSGVGIGHQHIDLYFVVKGGEYQRVSYGNIYIPKQGKVDPGLPDATVVDTVKADPSEHVVPIKIKSELLCNEIFDT
ncbi:MAG: hypothetical protein ABFS45_00385 [Pseudomonadota bacterium]